MSSDCLCPCCRYYTLTTPGWSEQCPVCGWTDSGIYNDVGSVWLDQAQRNFIEFGACSRPWIYSVIPPSPALRRASPPFTVDEWKLALATDFVHRARTVFANAPRPRHFTCHHCDECIEHDETMQAFDNDTLPLKPLLNPGWDPLCFLTPAAFRYFMPGLIRVQIEALQKDASDSNGWRYQSLLDFHLRDAESKRFSLFSPDEVQLVADLYQAILRCPGFESFFGQECQAVQAARTWLARAARTP